MIEVDIKVEVSTTLIIGQTAMLMRYLYLGGMCGCFVFWAGSSQWLEAVALWSQVLCYRMCVCVLLSCQFGVLR